MGDLSGMDTRFQWQTQQPQETHAGSFESERLLFLERTLGLMNEDLSYAGFCRQLLIALTDAVPSAAASLFEFDGEGGVFFFRASLGQRADHLSQIEVPINQGVVGHVATTREGYLCPDVTTDPFHVQSVGRIVDYEARNLIAIPIVVRGRVYGVIELLDRLVLPTYTADDLNLLSVLGSYCGSLIETRLVLSYSLGRLAA